MQMIDTNTYISIAVGAILVELIGVIFILVVNENLSKVKKWRFIYWSIISYGFVFGLTTILYKIEQLKELCSSFVASSNYIRISLLNKWYNFFMLWLNNDIAIQNSFFYSKSLKIFYFCVMVVVLSFLGIMLVLLISEGILFISDFLQIVTLFAFQLVTPIAFFDYLNTIFFFVDKSITSTWIALFIPFLILLFIIGGGIFVYEMEEEKSSIDLKNTHINKNPYRIREKTTLDSDTSSTQNCRKSKEFSSKSYNDLINEYAKETLKE